MLGLLLNLLCLQSKIPIKMGGILLLVILHINQITFLARLLLFSLIPFNLSIVSSPVWVSQKAPTCHPLRFPSHSPTVVFAGSDFNNTSC